MKTRIIAFATLLFSVHLFGQNNVQQINKNQQAKGIAFEIKFQDGQAHNHPTFSFWLEDIEGNFIQTLFVTQFVATGTYGHGELEPGKWKKEKGEAERPATLPYWLHKRNVKNKKGTLLPTADEPVADAYTSATPKANFVLNTQADKKLPRKFRLLMEINQPWDSNKFWNNAKHPGNWDYSASLQPALVYAVTIDREKKADYQLELIGHSHWAGETGELFTELSTLTTAKNIVEKVVVRIK